jgi:hypothetical protein
LPTTSDPDQQNLQPKGPPSTLPGLWTAVTTKEASTMKQLSLLLPRLKALAPCSRFWRRVVVYAPNLLGYTNNGSFRSTWSWEWFYVYFLHQPHLCCLTNPTGLQVLRPLGLMTPHSHHLYATCLHFLLPTAQLSPF